MRKVKCHCLSVRLMVDWKDPVVCGSGGCCGGLWECVFYDAWSRMTAEGLRFDRLAFLQSRGFGVALLGSFTKDSG